MNIDDIDWRAWEAAHDPDWLQVYEGWCTRYPQLPEDVDTRRDAVQHLEVLIDELYGAVEEVEGARGERGMRP